MNDALMRWSTDKGWPDGRRLRLSSKKAPRVLVILVPCLPKFYPHPHAPVLESFLGGLFFSLEADPGTTGRVPFRLPPPADDRSWGDPPFNYHFCGLSVR